MKYEQKDRGIRNKATRIYTGMVDSFDEAKKEAETEAMKVMGWVFNGL